MATTPKDDPSAPPSSRDVLYALRYILPCITAGSFALGITTPMLPYLAMNFFAQRHTDLEPQQVRCEKNMAPQHCQLAVFDSNRLIMVQSIASPMVLFVVLPAVGILSDAFGRKPLIVFWFVYGLLPAFAVLAFIFNNVSLYWGIGFSLFQSDLFSGVSPHTVLFGSYLSDILPHPAALTMAFAFVAAAQSAASLFGTMLGSALSMEMTFCTGAGICALAALYSIFILPESLPPDRRERSVTLWSLMPGVELGILWRTAALRWLCVLTILVDMLKEGCERIFPMLFAIEMAWDAHDNYIYALVMAAGTILVLGVFMQPLLRLFGETRLLTYAIFSGAAGTVLSAFVVTQPWHIMVVGFLANAPGMASTPLTTAFRAFLAGPDEQGLVQGAFLTTINIASSAGLLAFGAIFDATNRHLSQSIDEQSIQAAVLGPVNKKAFVIAVVVFIPMFVALQCFITALRAEGYKGLGDLVDPAEGPAPEKAHEDHEVKSAASADKAAGTG